MGKAPDLSDYVDVSERIRDFREKYPEGTLQPWLPELPFQVVEVGGQTFIVAITAAYRTPDDPRPGVGMAWEPFPGRTPYTRESELMNAETSANGRAIIAVGAADAKRIASLEEVRNRSAEPDNLAALEAMGKMCLDMGWTSKQQKQVVANAFTSKYRTPVISASSEDLESFVARVTSGALLIEFDTADESVGG